MSGTASSISEGLYDRRYSDRWRYFGNFPCIDTYASYACGNCNVRFWAGMRALFCVALTPLSLLFYLFSVLFHYFKYFTPSLLFSFCATALGASMFLWCRSSHEPSSPIPFNFYSQQRLYPPTRRYTSINPPTFFIISAARRIGTPLAHAHLSLLFLRPQWFSLLSRL